MRIYEIVMNKQCCLSYKYYFLQARLSSWLEKANHLFIHPFHAIHINLHHRHFLELFTQIFFMGFDGQLGIFLIFFIYFSPLSHFGWDLLTSMILLSYFFA